MTDRPAKIRFQGRSDLILTRGGAITTEEDYEAFRESYAHLVDDGRVMRYGRQIGTAGDIEIIGESPAECGRALFDVLSDRGGDA